MEENKEITEFISEEFLKKKSVGYQMRALSGNWTDKGNIYFPLYNMLGEFNGHFHIIVNPYTFDYRIKKIGDYGNLVSYIPVKDNKVWKSGRMTKKEVNAIEPCIAKALLDFLYPSITFKNKKTGFSCNLSNLIKSEDDF